MIVAATLLVSAGLALQLTRSQLTRQLDQSLADSSKSFQETVPDRVAERVAQGASLPDSLWAVSKDWLLSTPLADLHGAYVQIDGMPTVLAQSVKFRLPPQSGAIFSASSGSYFTLSTGAGSFTRFLRVPIIVPGGTHAGTLVLAASQSAAIDHSVRTLLRDIAMASAIGLVFATLLGLIAVRRTLRPLKNMSREVDAIQETDDLSKRLSGAGPPDEVGRLAEGFDRMLGRLQESFLSQRRFLSDASHELRTPMTVVRGQLELLSMDVESMPGRRSLAIALDELDRMGRIVEDLLLLARLDEGMTLPSQAVEVELVVGEALLRGMPAPGDVEVDIPPGLSVRGDSDRLLQVLTNLVTNAVRHAAGAAIRITGRLDGPLVKVSVADAGPGIPPEDLPHVFERLYRGSRARSVSPGGAGLGLAIAASLVRAMAGVISVTSTVGVGTTFTVTLPGAESPPV
ncbi:MAG: HAMP domain-containing sensor histidine kinase [Actinomycetota bacterium]